jgi:hypothetical protein
MPKQNSNARGVHPGVEKSNGACNFLGRKEAKNARCSAGAGMAGEAGDGRDRLQ